jgi:hypothetical protein
MTAVPGGTPAHGRWRRFGEWILASYFLLAALLFTLTTLAAIVNFAWRQPMFDQWREYENLIGLPFPRNVLQLDNGHRPILPNLVRELDIWLGGVQTMQILIGGLCAFLSAALLAWAAWRERALGRIARCAGVLLGVLGVLWLANARRLLHGNEAMNGYLPTVLAICAAWCMYRARASDSLGWIAAACAACIFATFSFGLGLATFGEILVLGVLLKFPLRRFALPVASMLACAALYMYVLPGNEGVRQSLQIEPLTMFALNGKWMASVWKWAWLDLAADPVRTLALRKLPETALGASASFVINDLGIDVGAACAVLGLVGIAVFATCVLYIFLRRDPATRLETVAIGSGAYALICGMITVLARMGYLHVYPDQVYADRYLLWPSLFWCSLGLLALSLLRGRIVRAAATIVLLALPAVFIVTQNRSAIWGSIVYREAQRMAAALRSGVFDEQHFVGEDIGREAQLREIALLRDHQLAMFADPSWQRLGTRWTGSLESTNDITVEAAWQGTAVDAASGKPAVHLEGWVSRGISTVQRSGQLVVLADDGTIAGFAEFGFIAPNAHALLLALPRKRGFDGYVRDPGASTRYTLAVLDFGANRGLVLAALPPPPTAEAQPSPTDIARVAMAPPP